ncbi:MAG: N-acetylneuraminate synthase family protein [Nanoarchaeota archaeon]
MEIEIDGRKIGDGHPCYFIVDIGSNHDGDIDRAKMLIDLAKESGAEAVKFQHFNTNKIVSKEGFEGLKSSFQAKWDKPVVEVYRAAEFHRSWTKELMNYAKKVGITFFSSPYDFEAVNILEELNVPAHKIGSGDITWLESIKYIASKGKPVILGTGASTMEEIAEAVETIKSTGNDKLVLLQCVTNYPSSFENANVKAMQLLRKRFGTLVGYSDHTPGHVVAMATVALGGCMIEKHFTDDKNRKGPDHPFAMDAKEFKEMVGNVRLLEKSLGREVKELYPEEKETVILQRRCIRATRDVPAGSILSKEMLEVLRPAPKGTLCPKEMERIIGKAIKVKISKGEAIEEDFF